MKKFDEINIIPFIDIMLVLLAIVLITASFISQGKIQDPHQRKSPPGQCEDRTAGGTTRLSLYRCQRRPRQ